MQVLPWFIHDQLRTVDLPKWDKFPLQMANNDLVDYYIQIPAYFQEQQEWKH